MSSIIADRLNNQLPPESAEMVLESLFNHKNNLVIHGLRKRRIDLPRVRTRSNLRAHTQMQLEAGIIDLSRIIGVLIDLEGWGRQQIYLYRWNGGKSLQNQWLDRQWVEDRFNASEMCHVYNNTRSIATQDDSTLFSVGHPRTGSSIRFIWTQYRTITRPTKEQDPDPQPYQLSPDGTTWQRTVLKAYLETIVRDVSSFEWNIACGEAMLMIRKFKGTDYLAVRDRIEEELADVLPFEDFRRMTMSKVIDSLDDIEDVLRPRVDYRALSDPNIRMTIAGRGSDDVLSNQQIQEIRRDHRDDFNGYGGFSKWKVDRNTWVGIDLYAKKEHDHRIGIRSEAFEKDVRRVLQRIRAHC